MNNTDIITEELRQISTAVANLNRRNVYSVPSGYFSGLANRILSYVTQHSNKGELGITTTPFKVPVEYFDNLSTQILGKIKQHQIEEDEVIKELAGIAPFLNSIGKTTPYSVPAGYFEKFEINSNKSAIRVVSRRKPRRFIQYAAAAAITGIMAIGGIFYLNNDNNTNNQVVGNFTSEDLKKLSEKEIIEYLESNSTTGVNLSNNVGKDSKLKDTQELSEEEIINFLKENPEPGDAYQVES